MRRAFNGRDTRTIVMFHEIMAASRRAKTGTSRYLQPATREALEAHETYRLTLRVAEEQEHSLFIMYIHLL